MAPVAPLTGVFLTQRQQTQSKSGCHAAASSPRGRRRPGLHPHHTRGETVFSTVAQRPTAIPRPTAAVSQEGGAVQRQSTSPSFTPAQRRAPPSPGTTQPPSPGLPPPKVGSRTIALPASKELEAFKTIQAVDCAVNAAQVALSGVTARRRRLSQQERVDQPFQKDSLGIGALKVARNEPSPSVGVRRAASLAAARMEHKESVDALGRSQKFTHGVLEKLDALQLTATAAH